MRSRAELSTYHGCVWPPESSYTFARTARTKAGMISRVLLGIFHPGGLRRPPLPWSMSARWLKVNLRVVPTISVAEKGYGGLSTAAPQPRFVGDRLRSAAG